MNSKDEDLWFSRDSHNFTEKIAWHTKCYEMSQPSSEKLSGVLTDQDGKRYR